MKKQGRRKRRLGKERSEDSLKNGTWRWRRRKRKNDDGKKEKMKKGKKR